MNQNIHCHSFVSVDINPAYISCWKKYGALPRRYYFMAADVRCLSKILRKKFSAIICNPPYYCVQCGRISPYYSRAVARHELALNLKDIFHVSRKLLKQDGRLYLIHIPSRLQEIIVTANEYGFYLQELKPVQITAKKTPKSQAYLMLLLFKNSRVETKITLQDF